MERINFLKEEIKKEKINALKAFCKRIKNYRGFIFYVDNQNLKAWKCINGIQHTVYIGVCTNVYKFKIDAYITRKGL